MTKWVIGIGVMSLLFSACDSRMVRKSNERICPETNLVEFQSDELSNFYLVELNPILSGIEFGDGASYQERQITVKDKAEQLFAQLGLQASVEQVYVETFLGFSVRLSESALSILSVSPLVVQTEVVKKISVRQDCETAPVEQNGSQKVSYGIDRVGAADGTGKRAWIIDTGIDLDHPDLNVNEGLSRSFVNGIILGIGSETPDDLNGHGTHVAGIIGAKNNDFGTVGVAFNAELIAVKVLDQLGDGSSATVIQGVDYVASQAKAGEVANLSLGGTASGLMDRSVSALAERGVLVAIAAGNESSDAANFSPSRVNGEHIYTVSAIDAQDNFASFSNFGNPPVDFAAPGVNILSTYLNGNYNTLSGTSMATPFVAGILLIDGEVKAASGVAKNDVDATPDPIAILSN